VVFVADVTLLARRRAIKKRLINPNVGMHIGDAVRAVGDEPTRMVQKFVTEASRRNCRSI
jgi:hypothetical protein